MELKSLENQLAELEEKKNKIVAKEKQLKARLSNEKRKKENHAKMVLGGAVFGVLKNHVPSDRKELDLYGRAVKAVFIKNEERLTEMINSAFETLKAEKKQIEQEKPEQSE